MAKDLTGAIASLRQLNRPVPKPRRLPTEMEVRQAEQKLGVSFHSDIRRYLLEASDVVYGSLEPVTITSPGSHTDLISVTEAGREYWRLPPEYIPICEDNDDMFCVRPDGVVVFWPHDGTSDESWPNVAEWINEVWIGEK